MPEPFKSKVSKAVAGSRSVRTTVPEAVAAVLGIEQGSTLLWTLEGGRAWVAKSGEEGKKSPRRR